MKGSIRKFLLINLLLTLIITTFLTGLGNYYVDRMDLRNHLDVLLVQANFNLQALLGNDLHSRNLKELQQIINKAPKQSEFFFSKTRKLSLYYQHEKYEFQVWTDGGKLLLHSAGAPTEPLSNGEEGIVNHKINGIDWRTFTTHNDKNGTYVVVAEKYKMITLLANSLAADDFYILLLIFPISGLLIWLIVGKGLDSIRKVTDEVSHRAPTYLEPVNANIVPPEIKPLVIELNKLFLRLHQALDREKRFAGDAAHELRTPLAALRTQAQVAIKTKDEKERKQLLNSLVAAVDRSTHIVQQLLTLSRLVPESNTLIDKCALDLGKLAAEVLAQLVPLALEKNIDIELVYDETHACNIQGNLTALGILIRNLVDNAIRYTPEKGKISIVIKPDIDPDFVLLKVIDNGPGIPAELRARVFERFFRVLGNKSSGSGLGLAIVQQIAQLHDAQVTLGSPPSGKGLEIEVKFKSL